MPGPPWWRTSTVNGSWSGYCAQALTPVVPATPGDVLHGRVRYIEHHGHESLAFIDIGAYAVPVDEPGPGAPQTNNAGSRLSKVAALFRRGQRVEPGAEEPGLGRSGGVRPECGG